MSAALELATRWSEPAKILVVDDDPATCQLLQTCLNSLGCVCTVATTGEEALARISVGRYDLVLLDLCLPGMHGIDVLRSLRQHQIVQPVAIISGYVHDLLERSVEAMGVVAVVAKPFKCEDIKHVLDTFKLRHTEVT